MLGFLNTPALETGVNKTAIYHRLVDRDGSTDEIDKSGKWSKK